MKYIVGLTFVAVFFGVPASAQKGPCTEEFITAAHAQSSPQHPTPKTNDFYLFNPFLEKPIVGEEEVSKAVKANDQLMAKQRKNMKMEPFRMQRVIVDPSGDMAYEYGTGHVSYDDSETGKHVDRTVAALNVWRADGGSCKMAAEMLQREGQR